MSLPRYPKYKDSGVEWLGDVPGHWEVKPIKAVSTCNDDVLEDSTEHDYLIDYIEISGVDAIRGISETTVIPFGNSPSRARRRVSDGDILVSTVRTYLRAIAPITNPPTNMIASTGFAVIRPRHIEPSFLGFMFQAEFLIAEIIARSVGVSYPAINASDLMRLDIPIPTREEQQAIAAFLDRETGKIDALIAEQRRLVVLLAEKRQAVISHAVTKGLGTCHSRTSSLRHSREGGNPAEKTIPQSGQGSCPATQESSNQLDSRPTPSRGQALRGNDGVVMKDSGIEWLGEVPEHWMVKPIKHLGRLKGGAGFPHADQGTEGEELSFHKVNALGRATSDGVLLPSDNTISHETANRLSAFVFPKNSIVFAKVGAALLLGRIRVIPEPSCLDNNMMGLVVNQDDNDVRFVRNSMSLVRFDLIANPGAVPSLNEGQIGNFLLAMPSLEEQHAIADFLDTEIAKFDTLTAEANRAIELLQERRSALISAAVTGKIDVRDLALSR